MGSIMRNALPMVFFFFFGTFVATAIIDLLSARLMGYFGFGIILSNQHRPRVKTRQFRKTHKKSYRRRKVIERFSGRF